MHQYLMDEHPHFFYPSLAERLGLNEAIVLQQIHSWIQTYTKDPKQYQDQHWHDGAWWIWNSYPDWHTALPYLSESTIRRTLAHLRELEIVKIGNYNRLQIDRTLWYTIDYAAYDKLWADQDTKMNAPSAQNEQMELSKVDRPLPDSSSALSSFGEEIPPSANSAPAPETQNPAQERLERMRAEMGDNPLAVMAHSARARSEIEHPDFTDASKDSDPWSNGPLTAFCAVAHLAPDNLKPSERRDWPKQLKKWSESWEDAAPTPDEVVQCMKAFAQSEHAWKTFTSPRQTSFQETMDIMLNRIRSGEPINATGRAPQTGSGTPRRDNVVVTDEMRRIYDDLIQPRNRAVLERAV